MTEAEIHERFNAILDDIEERSCVVERFVDRDVYRLYIATLWANVVLQPDDAGLAPDDLEPLHDFLNQRIARVLGRDECIRSCYRFVNSRDGERAMSEARLSSTHKDLLLYFSSMILDPEGHRRWVESLAVSDTER